MGLWDGIAQQALAINKTNHGNFFSLVQQFSLDAAVLRTSKIYDITSQRNKKHTAHDLIKYLENNLSKAQLWGYMPDTLTGLGISLDLINRTSSRVTKSERSDAFKEIIAHIKNTIPTVEKDTALEKIIAFRDKRAAHQQRLSKVKKKWLSTLPSTEDFIRLAEWGEHLSALVTGFFCNTSLMPHTSPCARMSVLNVLVKALDKNFDDLDTEEKWEEYLRFYDVPK